MKMNRLGNWLPRASAWTTTSLMLGLAMAACITRPVGTQPPTTKVNFTSTQAQQAVDKVDLLFAIDNSSSMGDKQQILADAVPTLLNGLLYPACVDPGTGAAAPVTDASNPLSGRANPVGTKATHFGCPMVGATQYEAEFTPVTDLHIGIVSSSLGTLGGGINVYKGNSGDLCPASDATRNNNDNGHLLARPAVADSANPNSKTDPNGPVAVASAAPPANFLSWFPESEANGNTVRHPKPAVAIDNSTVLADNFQSLVFGTSQNGCGLEAQLESVYRFLIQPDPFVQVIADKDGKADFAPGTDWDLLAQRAQFLRPDSLVAVIMLTDEDDSSADPLSIGGLGFNYASAFFQSNQSIFRSGGVQFGSTAPLPTSICATDPGNANCTTCGFAAKCTDDSAFCKNLRSDPNCAKAAPFYASDDDDMNVRFFHMKQRFGVDPQYPISRYVNGFSNPRVPDRTTEHTVTTNAAGSRSISDYVGAAKCTNPLYAAALPTAAGQEACKLPLGTRDVSKVFFALIGGVPNQLLYGAKADGTADYRPGETDHNAVTPDRWKTILGADPARFDYTGIDPHMIQSITPRPQLANGGASSSLRGSNGSDIISGREWDTKKIDLQYACVFDLATPKTCEGPIDPMTGMPSDVKSCDCNPTPSNQPLCQSATTNVQTKAKAYPTIRELEVVHALGDQGIAASLCPVDVATTNAANPNKLSPTYGYNPAVASIIDRLKNALTQTCLPQSLRDVPDGGFPAGADLSVPCLILAQLSPDAPSQDCGANKLMDTDAAVLKVFHEQQLAESTDSKDPRSLANRKVCTVPQVGIAPGASCKPDPESHWCYVENGGGAKPAGRCSQAIVFSAGTADLGDARFSLQCIRQFSPGAAAGDTTNAGSSQ